MAYVESSLGSVSAEAAKQPLLKKGSSGPAVSLAQTFLNNWRAAYKKGPALPLNGQFDNAFERAVKDFQKAVALSVDGKIGKNTWAALIGQKKPVTSAPLPIPELPLASQSSGLPSWVPLAAAGAGLALLLTLKK
jgi:peptidoglycan hydrolase-like protein with peptidoglycan-binding domain